MYTLLGAASTVVEDPKFDAKNTEMWHLTLNSGQFTLSTQLIKQNYPVILSQQCSTTVSLETYPLFYLSFVMWICSLMTGIHATSHTISDSLSALFIYFLNHYFHYSNQNVVVLLVVHKGIVCASCGQAVCGIRYKCWWEQNNFNF